MKQYKFSLDISIFVEEPGEASDILDDLISDLEDRVEIDECSPWSCNPQEGFCDICGGMEFEDDLIPCDCCGCEVCAHCMEGDICLSCATEPEDEDDWDD